MFASDAQRGSNRWHVIRLKVGSKTDVINLSSCFFPITTHWVGHTVPCCLDDCDLCELEPARGLFYLAVFCMSRTMMLELGAQSSGHLEQNAKLFHGGIKPGQVITLSRRGARQPIFSEIVGFQANTSAVKTLDLAQKVMALYKLPCANPSDSLETYASRCAEIVRKRNVALALKRKAEFRKST